MNNDQQQMLETHSDTHIHDDELSFSAKRTTKMFFTVLFTGMACNAILLIPTLIVTMVNSHFEAQERIEKDQLQRQRFIKMIDDGEHVGEATRLLYGIEDKPKD